MNKKIIFQKCHFNHIYFILYIVILFVNVLIQYNIDPDYSYLDTNSSSDSDTDSDTNTDTDSNSDNDSKINYFESKMINYLLTYNLSNFLAIIPYFIRKKLIKNRAEKIQNVKTEDNKLKDDTSLIYTENIITISDEKKKTIRIYLIILGICDFLQKFVMVLYSEIYPERDIIDLYSFSFLVPFEIVLQFVCSYLILKIHFYKLQYFSLFLN